MKFQSQPTTLSDDPLAVFAGLVSTNEHCFLLETLADTYQPQTTSQSYIGVAPQQVFRAKDTDLDTLRQQIEVDTSLPAGYNGGLVGYFSHEVIQTIEPTLEFPYSREFPDFEFGLYQDGLLFRPGQSPDYFHYGTDRADIYQAPPRPAQALKISFVRSAKDQAAYQHMVEKASNDIRSGRVFQVVLANRYEYQFAGDLLELYKELRRINPSPFMFFMKFGNVITMGASPEFLVTTKPDGSLYLEALAGTIRRGDTPAEDTTLASQLLSDEKEVAEHSMLVDLARNDAGRISQIGSVKIDDLMFIKKFSHVQHISSVISGQLRSDKDQFDALSASFPAGTLSGAPKIEAIKMVKELEGYERGPYGGTIGYFGFNGDSMHAVNLRSVSAVGQKLYVHSASGIVYDSTPEQEYQEITNKKAAMDQAMKPFISGEPL